MQTLKSSFLVLLAFITLTVSRPSQAAIGAAFTAPVAVTTGLVIAGGGGVIAIADLTSKEEYFKGLITVLIALPIMALGLIVLDEDKTVSFSALTATDARNLGISLETAAIFNAELDQANAMFAYVSEEMTASKTQTNEESVALWNDVKESVSPETFSTMVKIAEKLHK